MHKRYLLPVGGPAAVSAILGAGAIRIAALLAAHLRQAHADPAIVLQQVSLLAALASGAFFSAAVCASAVRLVRGGPQPWREPRPTAHRLVAYVATGLVGMAATPTPDARAAGPAAISATLRGGESTPPSAPDPMWQPSGVRAGTSPARGGPEIRLVGGSTRAGHDDSAGSIVVRRGDCLWDIVTRSLGPQATPMDVAREWPRWYAANRAIIGPDPNLLQPGQELNTPAGGV